MNSKKRSMNLIRGSFVICLLFSVIRGLSQESPEKMFSMSFEELMDVKVTTGTKYETSLRETHSLMHVLSASDIQAYGIENLGGLLNLIRGFYLSNDRNYLYTGVQGFSRPTDYNNRLLLMIDDHILNENVYGSAFMDQSFGHDLQFVDRVEVITGPGAALYGNGAMMAVVNVITMAEEKKENKIRLRLGNHQTAGAGFVFRDHTDQSAWFVSGNAFKTSGEDLFFSELAGQGNGGHAIGLDDEEAYAVYTRYKRKNLELKLSGNRRLKGIPTAPWETRLDERSESVDEQGFAELIYQRSFTRQSLKASVSWDLYRYKGIYGYPGVDFRDESVGSWGTARIEYQIDFNPKNRLMTGAEWHCSLKSDYMEEEDGVELFYKNNRFQNLSAFAQYDHMLNDRLRFLAGLRLDHYSYTDPSLSPRISAIYTPNRHLDIKYSFNKAFRAPNFYEMFYESSGENVSNPDLSPEIIYYNNLDIRNKITRSLHGGLSFFLYRMKKMIDPVVNDQELVMFVNTGDGHGKGAQVYGEGQLFKNMTIHASYSYQKLLVHGAQGEKTNASNFPVSMVKARLIYAIPKAGTFGFQCGWESVRRTLAGEKTPSACISSLNMRTVQFFGRCNVALKVNNLFDQRYFHPAGLEHTMDQIVQPRRNYQLSVEINL